MLKKAYVLVVVCLLGLPLLGGAQKDLSVCEGNVTVYANTPYKLSFTGRSGKDKSGLFQYYPTTELSNNSLWIQFKPTHNGLLSILSQSTLDEYYVSVFDTDKGSFCSTLSAKKANLLRQQTKKGGDTSALSLTITEGFSYWVAFTGPKGKTGALDFSLNYIPLSKDGKRLKDSLLLNLAYDKSLPVYGIHIRNAVNNARVIARVTLSMAGELDGSYSGSDILVNNKRRLKANVQVDAEGYYSKDYTNHVILPENHHDTITLNPISRGAIAKLDEIYFVGGKATIAEESYPRLKRLKDFLILNPSISIEVQGHVNDEGKRSITSFKLSKKRADKIVEYLVSSGIDPARLSAVGFGNTRPIFPEPTSEEEREANRRVEIKIR